MFLAWKGFNPAAAHLSLATGPSHTSFPCVLEDAGKINATGSKAWVGGWGRQPGAVWLCYWGGVAEQETLAHRVCQGLGTRMGKL